MILIILLQGNNISVRFKLHAIKIFNDEQLNALLHHNTKLANNELILLIKKKYFELYNVDFKVSNASMAIEIWAHVYLQKITELFKSRFHFWLTNKIAQKIINHCKEIDIGEKGHDDNRFVWNWLAFLKPVISNLFFKKSKHLYLDK